MAQVSSRDQDLALVRKALREIVSGQDGASSPSERIKAAEVLLTTHRGEDQ